MGKPRPADGQAEVERDFAISCGVTAVPTSRDSALNRREEVPPAGNRGYFLGRVASIA